MKTIRRRTMPPWHARLHLGSSSVKPSSTARPPGPKTPPQDQRFDDTSPADPPLHGVPLLPVQGCSSPSSRFIPRHSRSHSHPFPSLFSVNKRSVEEREAGADVALLERPDGSNSLNGLSPELSAKDPLSRLVQGTRIQNGGIDFVTGHCATCDSLVRWPKHVGIFRCTVCLMVNDFHPMTGPPGDARYCDVQDYMPDSNLSVKPGVPSKGMKYLPNSNSLG